MPTTSRKKPFVPADLDCSTWPSIEPYFQQLAASEITSPAGLRKWLADLSDLIAVVDEHGTRLYIDNACHADDAAIEKRYLDFVEQVEPHVKPAVFELQKKFLASPHRAGLREQKFAIMAREWQADVDLFRRENIPLQTQATKLVTQYNKLCAQMTVDYRGQTYTMQQIARFGEEIDRVVRQETWELAEKRRAQDVAAIDGIFEELLAIRAKIAANAGHANYRDYAWVSKKRFDYTPDDCHRFADAVEKTCMPVVRAMDEQRRTQLGVDKLRPWDLAVDPLGRAPLRPFDPADIPDFVDKTQAVLRRISPDLAEDFQSLRDTHCLDLESRKGKRPGGFQATLEVHRQPFIFMNAAGLHRDVETLLHEAGHAFHTLAARGEKLVFLHSAPLEFCEVASMSMELLADDYLDAFYTSDDAQRAKRTHLEGVIRLLPWIATIDQFQHWLYTHPTEAADADARHDAFLKISGRFSSPLVDWTGHEAIRRTRWQRQLHLFGMPFYYIEYGIAQLGALQVWFNYQKNPGDALKKYKAGLALGGTRPLPELFKAAGARFEFSAKTVAPLMAAVGKEIERLPA
ncbi:MAG: M3 family oligoendopeptidase [Phycisphaeraceae bacterium]|nr:M3 family oligoendopeptidase [Phycisphaeraceae bacterium]